MISLTSLYHIHGNKRETMNLLSIRQAKEETGEMKIQILARSAIGCHVTAKAKGVTIDYDIDIFRKPFYESPSL